MKKLVYLLLVSLVSFGFFSCNEKEDNTEWREANIAAYEKIAMDPSYELLKGEPGSPLGVYYKEVKKGNGQVYPIQTSKVKALYKGSYYDESVFDAGSSVNEVPVSFKLNEVVRGYSIALQNMVVGDKWEIAIPYHLGYGAADTYDDYGRLIMRGYTTLFFEIELLEIELYP